MQKKKTKSNIQTVMSGPSRILIGTYITKSGQTKNRYKKNSDAKPIKKIDHDMIPDKKKEEPKE